MELIAFFAALSCTQNLSVTSCQLNGKSFIFFHYSPHRENRDAGTDSPVSTGIKFHHSFNVLIHARRYLEAGSSSDFFG